MFEAVISLAFNRFETIIYQLGNEFLHLHALRYNKHSFEVTAKETKPTEKFLTFRIKVAI